MINSSFWISFKLKNVSNKISYQFQREFHMTSSWQNWPQPWNTQKNFLLYRWYEWSQHRYLHNYRIRWCFWRGWLCCWMEGQSFSFLSPLFCFYLHWEVSLRYFQIISLWWSRAQLQYQELVSAFQRHSLWNIEWTIVEEYGSNLLG